ncbi:MAG TPA: lipoprotein-releasing ABC transporter permease subunit [Gammaproteobacteria bacterium]|nr:lipoprotein-releasing ABC transporter permease subunit [Gammaproteobacteria bacterium]
MFRPLEWFIGLRYLRSRRRRGVVSFMSAASLIGIALGVAALLVILSVMNGLETETRSRLLSMTAHATIAAPQGLTDWRDLEGKLAAAPGVTGVSPFVTIEGMLTAGTNLQPAVVRGIDPEEERRVSGIEALLQGTHLADLEPGSRRIILGRALAINLGLAKGDTVTLLVPRLRAGRIEPRLASFTVAGTFQAGITESDTSLALVNLRDASELKGLGGAAEGLAVRLVDPLGVSGLRAGLTGALPPGLRYSDWTEDYRSLFTAMHIEKVMMRIILMLIVGVAAFNIVASLMMVVIDKQKDIAILRTYGLEPKRVARVFVVQGSVIGLVGTAVGTILGLTIAFNIGVIVPWLESTLHFQIMPGDVYYVTQLPSEVHLFDAVTIPVAAFLVAMLATVYPARRAAAIAPALALRYD